MVKMLITQSNNDLHSTLGEAVKYYVAKFLTKFTLIQDRSY